MLVGKREPLDLQALDVSEQAIEVHRQRMGSQFGVSAGTYAPKTMGMSAPNPKLLSQLIMHRFNNLALRVQQPG